MKHIPCLIFLLFFLVTLCLPSFGQEKYPDAHSMDWNELYKSAKSAYGPDQILINGSCYEDAYWGKIGHPFLFDSKFNKGTLVFRGIVYQNLHINFDIFNQQVILYVTENNTTAWIIPPSDFVSSFSFLDKYFIKWTVKDQPKYYQVIFDDGNLKCLYYWYKTRFDSDHKIEYSSSIFTESKKKTYLLIDGDLRKYSSNKSFVKLLPKNTQPEIKKYLKKNHINITRCSDIELKDLLKHYKSL